LVVFLIIRYKLLVNNRYDEQGIVEGRKERTSI